MKYNSEKAAIELSVTELCRLALLSGDLDLSRSVRFTQERAAMGAELHRKLQASAGAMYNAEVAFSHTALYHDICFEVSGRADGVIRAGARDFTVDEIKTVSGRAFSLPPAPMHDAQVKCYAYFLCCEKDLKEIKTRMTYYCIDDGKLKHTLTTHQFEDLKRFYYGLLSRVEYRAQILIERENVLIPSVQSGRFPYSAPREGQDIMLGECYRDIKAGKRLFIQAPTGTGKTVSALYPAIRALGEGYCDKIFYLTAKASTRREAFRAAADIYRAGSHTRTVVLGSRERLCQNEAAKCDTVGISRHCNPESCPYAVGFYDKLGAALCELLAAQKGYTISCVEELAKKYGICPYELQLELSEFCDTVICDYNYVFDPQIYLHRYFEEAQAERSRYVFLVDEAHNLGDRACDMYSVVLVNTQFDNVISLLPEEEEKTRKALSAVSLTLNGVRRLCEETVTKDENGVPHGYYLTRNPMEKLLRFVCTARTVVEARTRTLRGNEPFADALSVLSSQLKRFEVISEYYDERFLTFAEQHGDEITVRMICLDPSEILGRRLALAHASVLFSATLTPTDYFADILGGGRGAVKLSLPSPFDPARTCLAVVDSISTRYEDREASYKRIAGVIAGAVSGKKGNYIVYFPSYDYMEKVVSIFTERYKTVQTVVQTRGMSFAEKEKFLDAFVNDGQRRVGFCVLGGSFSEGVDLPGDRLIGTVIVGTGIPGISNERNILKEYYDVTRENGYDYAYTYPGMNRVLQAAGRVIRREEDAGVIVLVDDRYGTDRYKALFPEHWQNIQYARTATELAELVADFWSVIS
ncbi:MAG: ATP-dependent DNA helicase [Clostridia bacterium]|nr:ATP-dependent DNA helicase [Clostridia bacterium]